VNHVVKQFRAFDRTQRVVVTTIVCLVLAASLVDALALELGRPFTDVNAFLTGHAFFTSILASFLLLLVAVYVFEAIQRSVSAARAETQWAPHAPALIDEIFSLIEEYRARNLLGKLEEELWRDEDLSPLEELERDEIYADIEDNIMRGKTLTPGQMSVFWDGRSEAGEQLRLVRHLGSCIADLRVRWNPLLELDQELARMLQTLADALATQRRAFEDYTEASWSPEDATTVLRHADEQLDAAEKILVERYAAATGRPEAGVRRMLSVGGELYAQRKLEARRQVTYPQHTRAGQQPRAQDPDDDCPF
jgi:hypothetical protein